MNQLNLLEPLHNLEAAESSWLAWARSYAKSYCALHGSVTSDDVRLEADRVGLQPNSQHSWGALFLERGWACVGRQRSAVRSNNGRFISVWRWEGEHSNTH